ncbi:MAG: phosphatase PAP2 family protein [Acidobacteria bacterium]|jgi:membrane-associated phospholipid phosphatase|nr:phosphatase PAP2 family protein [Acidobacteriota bacterium]
MVFARQDLVLLLGLAFTVAAFWGLAAWCLPGESIPRLVSKAVRRHAMDWIWLFYVATLVVIIFLDILETKYDAQITSYLRWDFTPYFLRLEGPATALFQVVNAPWLTYVLSAIYLYVFPVIGLVAILVTYREGEFEITRKLFWGAILNYLFIIPFYILVPVAERWSASDGEVQLLMNQISPFLIEGLRPLSGLNNCFPSFHTSLAFSFAMLVARSRNQRLRRTMTALAWLVLFSTLYLGFHWVLDVFGGLIFAAFCVVLSEWAVENLPLETAFQRARAR